VSERDLDPDPGQKIRKRVRWLNREGGFGDALDYGTILEEGRGLAVGRIFAILKQVEDNWSKISHPMTWLCVALRKACVKNVVAAPEHERKVRDRLRWLNSEGGFAGALDVQGILEAAEDADTGDVMEMLIHLQENWDQATGASTMPLGEEWPTAVEASAQTGKRCRSWQAHAARRWKAELRGLLPLQTALTSPPLWPPRAAVGASSPSPSLPSSLAAAASSSPCADAGAVAPAACLGAAVENATAWVCAALDKAVSERDLDPDPGQKIRKRVRWLNREGGFGDALDYGTILEEGRGLAVGRIFAILKQVEDNWSKISHPMTWLCVALRKACVKNVVAAPEHERKVRDRLRWLNSEGGFAGALDVQGILEAAEDTDTGDVMEMLTHLQENWDKVGDPTGWVLKSLRNQLNMTGHLDEIPVLLSRLQYLNGSGCFDGALDVDNIVACSEGVDADSVFEMLKHLEDNWMTIGDPMAWLLNSFRRASPSRRDSSSKASDFRSLADVGPTDHSHDKQLRLRVGWLNREGGFVNTLNFEQIAEAAKGIERGRVNEVLDALEEKWQTISNPMGWLATALHTSKSGNLGVGHEEHVCSKCFLPLSAQQRQRLGTPHATDTQSPRFLPYMRRLLIDGKTSDFMVEGVFDITKLSKEL